MATTSTATSRPAPRPLRLVSGTGSTNGSLSSPLSASITSPSFSNVLRDSPTNDTHAPSPRTRYGPRRQSSISYNTGMSSPRTPVMARSNSMSAKALTEAIKGENAGEDASAPRRSPLPAVREGEPITLAEKHADLLHFIAQKEAKCLELRTQLAQHEADLQQLKRKWERIVSKGVPQAGRSDAPSSSLGATEVLEGIKGGVQSGLEKMLAVLEPTSTPSSSSQPSPISSSSSSSTAPPRDPSPVPTKRFSTSTMSSVSGHGRSSLNGSRSSASSLFDDISSLGDYSVDTSLDEDEDTSASSHTEKANKPRLRMTPPRVSLEQQAEGSASNLASGVGSLGRRKPRPMSITLTSPATLSPLTKQVANWVPPSLNKKWEELKGNETISKQSKRASLLLNDMFAALASPSTSEKPSSRHGSSSHSHKKAKAVDITLLGLDTGSFGAGTSPSPTPSPKAGTPWDILGDDTLTASSPSAVLKPDVLKPTQKVQEPSKKKEKVDEKEEDDDEEWNW